MDENRRVFLQDLCPKLFTRQVGVFVKHVFSMQKGKLLRKVGILVRFKLGEKFLD